MSNVKTKTTLGEADLNPVFENLKVANRAYNAIYPGEIADRQPVHTVYGGAQLFKPDRTARMGKSALKSLKKYCISQAFRMRRLVVSVTQRGLIARLHGLFHHHQLRQK